VQLTTTCDWDPLWKYSTGEIKADWTGGGKITTISPNQTNVPNPEMMWDLSDPNATTFWGTVWENQLGKPIDITFCNTTPLSPGKSSFFWPCPAYYALDNPSKTCQYQTPSTTKFGPGIIWLPGYGSLPVADENTPCPSGFYKATYEQTQVCIPASGPECSQGSCAATCPPGLTINDSSVCCDYPEDVPVFCPVGTAMLAGLATCVYQPEVIPGCTTVTVTVPACTPPSQNGGGKPKKEACSTFSTQSSCPAYCYWYTNGDVGVCMDKN
jgi:hypothetical protein